MNEMIKFNQKPVWFLMTRFKVDNCLMVSLSKSQKKYYKNGIVYILLFNLPVCLIPESLTTTL